MQKQGRKQAEQRKKYAFLESVFEEREEKGQIRTKPGRAHVSTVAQAQLGSSRVKLGRRGAGPSVRALGARLRPLAAS
jgi:hypothetical protein